MTQVEFSQHFFLQVALILLVVGLLGKLSLRLGQPVVVGEMIAGILIGPSVLGMLAPSLHAQLFPEPTIDVVYVVSQVGLVLYMFLVGAEFQIKRIDSHWRSAVSVSLAGIIAPFILGGLLALALVGQPGLFPAHVRPLEAVLFMGTAMSITAFPVLARIIQELGLAKTSLGTLTLAAAAFDDVIAWCLLAFALASLGGTPAVALTAIGGAIVYTLVVLWGVRPALRWLEGRAKRFNELGRLSLSLIILLLMLGAYFTERVGIHAVFGAFVLGLTVPRGLLTRELERRLKPIVSTLLLPLFFVYSGLNTQLGLVALRPSAWGLTVGVFLVACLGKGVACWLAARLRGESAAEALGIGTLMNARGLTELIILNIGLERGIIGPTLFAVLVIMALGTTLMTTPLFRLVYRRPASVPRPAPAVADQAS
jgi:Kef-type K+ transport system membrane component KefB